MKLLNILGFIAFVYATIATAWAHPFTQPECYEFATHAYVTGVYRDNGMKLEEIIKAYKTEYFEQRDETSYLKDQEDIGKVLKMIERVFNSPQPPEVAAQKEYAACMKHVADTEV
jgi:hypothetical protein